MSEKLALIIATSRYQDAAIQQLVAPAQDAESLARVLGDPTIGGFQVRTLVNEPSHKVSLEIESFCDNRKRDDLLLLYFSCHGIKDTDGLLYFAMVDTKLVQHNVRRATAVGAEFVNQAMSRSRSRRQILLLDCCYSGAFKEGMLAKAGKGVGVGQQFQGQGRVVLTASDALQYSFEGEQVQGEGAWSVFTHVLVRGLETGEADLDRDGSYSLDEVYDYLYARVSDEQPEQKPMKMGYMEGKIFIGNNPRPRPADLPPELRESLEDSRTWVRLGAVQELGKLLAAHNKGLVLAARVALAALAKGDDSFQVRTAADKCLTACTQQLAAQRIEAERTVTEQAERERLAAEQAEAERAANEKARADERERLAAEQTRVEQENRHAAEQARLENERRKATDRATVEQQRRAAATQRNAAATKAHRETAEWNSLPLAERWRRKVESSFTSHPPRVVRYIWAVILLIGIWLGLAAWELDLGWGSFGHGVLALLAALYCFYFAILFWRLMSSGKRDR